MPKRTNDDMNLKSSLKVIGLASMLTAATSIRAQVIAATNTREILDERFGEFLARLTSEKDSAAKSIMVDDFVKRVRVLGHPVIEDSTVHLLYYGKAERVSVPSDLNGWTGSADTMKRIPGTSFFHLPISIDEAARFEYKLVVDSTWILDPLNQQQAIGGYGPNSEIWMPRYAPPKEIEFRPDIPHGRLDALSFKSKLLRRTHPVFVYTPPGRLRKGLPSIFVTDGGEYISLALMVNVLDNLIHEKRIGPAVGIFIDPRTDVRNAETSKRMTDYALSDTFVNAVITELRPILLRKYSINKDPKQTAILGASLGGLISTYAAYQHPEVFGLSAAQSPSYWWKDEAVLKLIRSGPKRPVKFYVGTGTIRDAQTHARRMKDLLESKGYEMKYEESPESHNWVNWRARLPGILEYFWGKK